MFKHYTTEQLYKIRNACDQIENPKSYISHGLCCYLAKSTNYSSDLCCWFVDSIFKPTFQEKNQFPGQAWVYYFSNYNDPPEEVDSVRIIAAGFLACLIDDELIARGE